MTGPDDMAPAGVEAFIAHEAALADGHDYDGWLALWEQDGTYFVPTSASLDDEYAPAIIRDTYPALAERIERLKTGLVHSQTPPSEITRVVGRAVTSAGDDGLVMAEAAFVLVESRPRRLEHWAGRYRYRLRVRESATFGIVEKRATLVNRDTFLPPLTFLV